MPASGLNDLLRGGNKTSFIEAVEGFKINIDAQNKYHSNGLKNEFCVAPLMNPPRLCWFPDNGQEPPHYENRLVEIAEMNEWICSRPNITVPYLVGVMEADLPP